MITIKKSVIINAAAAKIWPVLVTDELNRQWFSDFSPTTVAITDWKEGSKVIFKDDSNTGLVGIIESIKPGHELIIAYTGVIAGGAEDYESAEAKNMVGAYERYYLTENNGQTELKIETDTAPDYMEMMAANWDSALIKIKALAEK